MHTDLSRRIEGEIPHLRCYAAALTRDRADMEDLVQDCLERALARQGQFRPNGDPATDLRRWLFTILRNLHIDSRRKAARQGYHVAIEDWHGEPGQPPAQDHVIRLGEIAERMRALRPCDRRIVLLSVFSDLDHDGIARRMKIATGTVKSRLFRARRRLAA